MTEGSPLFPTTNWQDLANIHNGDEQSAEALERLCNAYWFPIYTFIRKQNPDPNHAMDLTQAFFGRLLEKESLSRVAFNGSRFRSFLLTACRNFLTDAHRFDSRQARRPEGGWISLDASSLEERYTTSTANADSPERCFERQWALTTIDRAFGVVEAEYLRRNKGDLFKRLQKYLDEDPDAVTHRQTADEFGISESAVKTEIHRLRQKLREALQREVAATVSGVTEAENELTTLLLALGG